VAEQGVATDRRGLGVVDRLPVRKVVLITLSVVIGVLVVVGAYRTLTLPAGERLDFATWRDLVIAGVALGSMYAMIALGYSLVYGILRMINFAHGEVFMAGAMISFFVGRAMNKSGFMDRQPLVALVILFIVGASASTAVAVLLERVAYRPLRSAPRLVPLITAIGASLFLQNSFQGFFGPQNRGYVAPSVVTGHVTFFGARIGNVEILAVAIGLVSVVGLSLFVSRTRSGRSMRGKPPRAGWRLSTRPISFPIRSSSGTTR